MEKGYHPNPVRLYAPKYLVFKAKYIIISDDIMFLEERPKMGSLQCEKLTLAKSQEEDPDYFEIMKSWVQYDTTEVEIIQK